MIGFRAWAYVAAALGLLGLVGGDNLPIVSAFTQSFDHVQIDAGALHRQ